MTDQQRDSDHLCVLTTRKSLGIADERRERLIDREFLQEHQQKPRGPCDVRGAPRQFFERTRPIVCDPRAPLGRTRSTAACHLLASSLGEPLNKCSASTSRAVKSRLLRIVLTSERPRSAADGKLLPSNATDRREVATHYPRRCALCEYAVTALDLAESAYPWQLLRSQIGAA